MKKITIFVAFLLSIQIVFATTSFDIPSDYSVLTGNHILFNGTTTISGDVVCDLEKRFITPPSSPYIWVAEDVEVNGSFEIFVDACEHNWYLKNQQFRISCENSTGSSYDVLSGISIRCGDDASLGKVIYL